MRKPRLPPKPPNETTLHNAALAHLARYAATESGLARVLHRRVDRWARAPETDPDTIATAKAEASATIAQIVARLAESGALSDAAFAGARARTLSRAGRSRRAIGAHLASHGVPSELAADALPHNPDQELAAALIHARRRRMGPWRRAAALPETARKELGGFARAGFSQATARQALAMDVEEAEAVIAVFRAEL